MKTFADKLVEKTIEAIETKGGPGSGPKPGYGKGGGSSVKDEEAHKNLTEHGFKEVPTGNKGTIEYRKPGGHVIIMYKPSQNGAGKMNNWEHYQSRGKGKGMDYYISEGKNASSLKNHLSNHFKEN